MKSELHKRMKSKYGNPLILLYTQENIRRTMTTFPSVICSRKQLKWSGSHQTTQGITKPLSEVDEHQRFDEKEKEYPVIIQI